MLWLTPGNETVGYTRNSVVDLTRLYVYIDGKHWDYRWSYISSLPSDDCIILSMCVIYCDGQKARLLFCAVNFPSADALATSGGFCCSCSTYPSSALEIHRLERTLGMISITAMMPKLASLNEHRNFKDKHIIKIYFKYVMQNAVSSVHISWHFFIYMSFEAFATTSITYKISRWSTS